jgi:predicted nuclease of predicted toxin-antitoxin system
VKFLIDNQLPVTLANWLASRGHETFHVLGVGLAQAKDPEIWNYAAVHSCVIVTKDEDFVRLATLREESVNVIWVRLDNCRTTVLLAAFDSLLPQMLSGLESGARLIEIR